MEHRFAHDFGRILIHTDPLAARAAAALAAEAFTVGHHIVFSHERFRPGTAQGKHLVAHELTHTIQQAATSPQIALSPNKKGAAPTPERFVIDGRLLGWNQSDEQVRVKREVGGTQGYDDRLQAIAVARLAKAEPAAVVQDRNKKWHAVEITANFEAGPARMAPSALEASAVEDTPFLAVYGLPSLTGIEQSRRRVDELKTKLVRLDALEQEWKSDPEFRKSVEGSDIPFLTTIREERERTSQNLAQANQVRARSVLGVPESDIRIAASLSGRTAGKVNIIGSPEESSPGGGHSPMGGATAFEEGLASAFWIDLPELDKARAAETMFHEVSHIKDWELAQEWIRNYKTETKRLFVKGNAGRKPFEDWLNAQVKKARLTKADMELLIMETSDDSAYSEARANVRSFLADLQAGAPDLATKALVGYANALKPRSQGGQYASPAPKSEVKAALVTELKTAYRQMPKNMQTQYDAAVTAAKKENPSAWISELEFSKRAGR